MMMDVAKSDTLESFTVSNKVFLFLIKLLLYFEGICICLFQFFYEEAAQARNECGGQYQSQSRA